METSVRTLWTGCFTLLFSCFSMAVVQVSYTLLEDQGPNKLLGNIATNANLASLLSDTEELDNLRYSLLPQNHPHTFRFTIDEITSDLRTKLNIDRDEICKYSPEKCEVSLEVAAQAYIGTFFEKIAVTITVQDRNEHSPHFNKSSINLAISESSLVNSKFPIDSARDEDSKKFSVVSYRVVPTDSPFKTETSKSLDDNLEVKLVLSQELDREKTDSYQIKIIAEDGGSPPKSGTLDVNITVTDVNDNAPVFSERQYNITVTEDVGKDGDSVILQLNATDADKGRNGEVVFKISANQPQEIQSIFAINEITGELRVVKHLLYEPMEMYRLIVEAYDKAVQPSKTQVYVYVHVQDSGNDSPEISINLLFGANVAKISEYAIMGTPVAHVVVTDDDTGRFNSLVTCNISVGFNYFQLQRLDINEYKVIVQKPLDRETIKKHHISVFCTDHGSPPMNSTKNFTAEVLDENDEEPVFTKPIYVESVRENNIAGDVAVQVYATDRDTGDNARIHYQLHPDAAAYFTIGNFTGIITANTPFDRETKAQYKFQVFAIDMGDPPLTATTTVTINIDDVNDNTPQFVQTSYSVTVNENMPIDTNVTKVYATDLDTGRNALVTFKLDSKDYGVPFIVLPDGVIRTTIELDREVVPQYIFTVVATDHGSPARKTSVKVTVKVKDQNDNAPVITFPNVSNDTVRIPYNSRLNTVVAVIKAFDRDDGINKQLVYSITSRNDSDIFNINSRTGEVIIAKQLQDVHINKYFIKVAVSDQGIQHQLSTTKLNIFVTERNSSTDVVIGDDKDNQYNVAIVVTVVVVTVVLSATILVTIFVIRHLDRQKQKFNQAGLVIDGTKMTNEKVFNNAMGTSVPDGKGPLYSLPGERVGMMSYATEHSLDRMSMSSHNTFQTNNEHVDHSQRCESPRDDIRQSELHRLASIRLHQALIQSHDKSQHPEFPYSKDNKRSGDDHNSDTSGDTIPSDSGRGGSEDEIVSHSLNSEDLRKYHIQYGRRGETPAPSHRNNYSNESHYMSMSRPPVQCISSGMLSPRLHDELKHQLQPPINPHPLPPRQPKTSHSSTSSEVPSYGHFQRGLIIPPVDETLDSVATGYDDDDTTTSGSYTIEADDFPLELHLQSVHDVFV